MPPSEASPPATSWPRDALTRGTDLNGYRIEEVIGRGGFGITYRAVDGIDQTFAIKEYFPRQLCVRQGNEVFAADEASVEPFNQCLERFGLEARALRQLGDIGAAGEGIVKVLTFFPANGTAYAVMEFVQGLGLDKVIRDAPAGISQVQLQYILPRLVHAIGCVHAANLLHRDIKPANIILRPDGRPVLIDFGAVRTSTQGTTVTYTQIFSEGYAPIEQFSGTRQGPYSDIYALGATLYRAIGGTGVDSFTRHQALMQGKRDPLQPAIQIGGGRYDTQLLAAIDAALTVAPEQRPQSIAELTALMQGGGTDQTVRFPHPRPTAVPLGPTLATDLPTEIARPPPANAKRRGRVYIGVSVGILVLSCGMAAWINRGAWLDRSPVAARDVTRIPVAPPPDSSAVPSSAMPVRTAAPADSPAAAEHPATPTPIPEPAPPPVPPVTAAAPAESSPQRAADRRAARIVLSLAGLSSAPVSDQELDNAERDAVDRFLKAVHDRPLPGVPGLDLTDFPALANKLSALLVRGDVSPGGVHAAAIPSGPARFARARVTDPEVVHPGNAPEAAYWYALGARVGDLRSFTALGHLLARSADHNDRSNIAGAALLWWLAAFRGEPTAAYDLGAMYEHGVGVPSSLEDAAGYYRLANDAGSVPALAALERLGL